MPSETVEKTTAAEQSDPDPPSQASTSGSVPGSSTPSSPSRADRLRAWLSAHPLCVEASLAVVSIGIGVLAVPIVAFGSLVALEGETRILAAGMILVLVGALSLLSLAVSLLVHAHLDVRRGRLRANDGSGAQSVAYTGSRVLQTLTAGTLLLGLLASALSLAARSSVPDLLILVVGAASVLLPPLVLVHAAGWFVGTSLDIR